MVFEGCKIDGVATRTCIDISVPRSLCILPPFPTAISFVKTRTPIVSLSVPYYDRNHPAHLAQKSCSSRHLKQKQQQHGYLRKIPVGGRAFGDADGSATEDCVGGVSRNYAQQLGPDVERATKKLRRGGLRGLHGAIRLFLSRRDCFFIPLPLPLFVRLGKSCWRQTLAVTVRACYFLLCAGLAFCKCPSDWFLLSSPRPCTLTFSASLRRTLIFSFLTQPQRCQCYRCCCVDDPQGGVEADAVSASVPGLHQAHCRESQAAARRQEEAGEGWLAGGGGTTVYRRRRAHHIPQGVFADGVRRTRQRKVSFEASLLSFYSEISHEYTAR